MGKRRFEAMAKNGFLKRHGIVRNAIRKDMLQFALPAMTVFVMGFGIAIGVSVGVAIGAAREKRLK